MQQSAGQIAPRDRFKVYGQCASTRRSASRRIGLPGCCACCVAGVFALPRSRFTTASPSK